MPPPAYLATSFVAVVAIAACGRREPASHAESPRDAGPPPVDARIYTEADLGEASYRSAAEIAAALRHEAKGRLAVVRVRRDRLRRKDITAFPCEEKAWPVQKFFLSVTPDTRDAIRALPVQRDGECPRVLVKILSIGSTGFSGYRADDGSWKSREDESLVVSAETLAVLDVTPRAKTAPPAGADYATLVDAMLGPEDSGAVVSARLERPYDPRALFVSLHACDPTDFRGSVLFRDEPLDGPLAKLDGCQTVWFRTRTRGHIDWGDTMDAELIRIGP